MTQKAGIKTGLKSWSGKEIVMPKEKDPNTDPQNMGGPSFHPNVGKEKAPGEALSKKDLKDKDTAILDQDQVPPL